MRFHEPVLGAAVLLAVAASGCATATLGGGDRSAWPYAAVGHGALPPELQAGAEFVGGWLDADPGGVQVLAETAEPRYVAHFTFQNPSRRNYLDFGAGTRVETLGYLEEGRTAVLVASADDPYEGQAVFSRALILYDLERAALVDILPISRDGRARGLAIDHYKRRVFLLSDNGEGRGAVAAIDLYRGTRIARRPVGTIPRTVIRKGLVTDREGNAIFCLTGGESARSDFAPVGEGDLEPPGLVRLEGDSLRITGRLDLDAELEPVAMAHDPGRNRIYILETAGAESWCVIVDVPFFEIRGRIRLPEAASDLALAGGFAFLPGATGIYIVDLDLESWVSRPGVRFEFPGEIAVAGNLTTAFVAFQSARNGGAPGIVQVNLQNGAVEAVFQ